MSATLKTPNFNLPYFAPSDTTTWQAFNDAVNSIDSALQTIKNSGDTNNSAIESIQTAMQTITENVAQQGTQISTQSTDIAGLQTSVNLINQTDVQQNQKISTIENQLDNLQSGLQLKTFNAYLLTGQPTSPDTITIVAFITGNIMVIPLAIAEYYAEFGIEVDITPLQTNISPVQISGGGTGTTGTGTNYIIQNWIVDQTGITATADSIKIPFKSITGTGQNKPVQDNNNATAGTIVIIRRDDF